MDWSYLCIQLHHVGNLKLAMVGVFTPSKSAIGKYYKSTGLGATNLLQHHVIILPYTTSISLYLKEKDRKQAPGKLEK